MAMQFFTAQDTRRRSVELFGTPNFLHVYGAIAAGAFEYLDLEEDIPRMQKYLPIKTVVMTNNSAAAIDIAINGIFYTQIPAGVITTITESIRFIRATNNDTPAAAAGLLLANFKTAPLGADEAARIAFANRRR